MFEVLPASGAAALTERAWGSRFASIVLHGVLIVAAVRLTAQAPRAAAGSIAVVDVFLPGASATTRDPPPAPLPGVPHPPVPTFVALPDVIPPATALPPVISAPFVEAGQPPGPGAPVVGEIGVGAAPGPGVPMDARIADEPPVLLRHPALRYPEVLRQALVEGRVLVEAVLDTTGAVETGSLRIVEGAHPLFEAEARAIVQASRYRPGRFAGRAVRVRIRVPVTFALRR